MRKGDFFCAREVFDLVGAIEDAENGFDGFELGDEVGFNLRFLRVGEAVIGGSGRFDGAFIAKRQGF